VSAGLRAGKSQPVAAQDAFIRVCAQERLHQRGEARLLRFFPLFHLQGFIDFRQQLASFPVGQKAVVAHHLKVFRRDMTDIAPEHLFLRQRLLPVLLSAVIVIVVHHGTAAVVPQLRCRHWWSLQVPAGVFDASPGTPGLLREVDLPAAPVLRFQIATPLFFVADMAQPRQAAGIYQGITVTQQAGDRTAPDFLHGVLLKKNIAPDAVFHIKAAAGDGEVNVRMPVELAAVCMQGAEDTNLHALFAGPPEHGAGGSPEQGVEQRPVVVKKGPQQVGHGESDMLPVAVGKDVALLRYPLLGGFEAAGAAGF